MSTKRQVTYCQGMIARRAPTMAEHYSKPSRRDERRKLIFGASYFRPGRRERRPERRNVNARAHARKPWEKILAPTSCANSSSFEASHYPPHPFSHPSLHLIDRWNVISLLPSISIIFRSVWNSKHCSFVTNFWIFSSHDILWNYICFRFQYARNVG